jgi:hypothetical protein
MDRVLLENLTGFAASQEIPHIYGTRKFITILTSARHLSLSWARSIWSPQPPPTSWRSILISSSHLRLGLPNSLFPSDFPTKTLCTPLPSPHARHRPGPSPSSWFYHPHKINTTTLKFVTLLLRHISNGDEKNENEKARTYIAQELEVKNA